MARAAFPHRLPYLTFHGALGTIFQDEDFAALFPTCGQPGLPPGAPPWSPSCSSVSSWRTVKRRRPSPRGKRTGTDPILRGCLQASRDSPWAAKGMVHVSEACAPKAPHVLTHVHTTTAAVMKPGAQRPYPSRPGWERSATEGASGRCGLYRR